MPILEKLDKHKNQPVTIIFKGANVVGVELSKLLIEQGSFVILIDEYTQKRKSRVSSLLGKDIFSFVDTSGIQSLAESIERVDYIFFLNHESHDPNGNVSTSDFLERSNTLDALLRLATEKKSKFLLTSSIKLHRILQEKKDVASDFDLEDESLVYTNLEVQRYAENLTWEYYKRGGLNARIIRVGEILGEGIDFDEDSLVVRFIKDAISGKKLKVEGDGLENLYFVHVLDAAYGLIKAQFTEKTLGQIYSLVIPRDITVLNLAYKILDLEPRAGGIDFIDKETKEELHVYKPAENLKSIGWKPKVSFERALASTIDSAYEVLGKRKSSKEKHDEDEEIRRESPSEDARKKKRSLKDFLINFFFEVKEEDGPRSVLDSVQYGPGEKGVEDKFTPQKDRRSHFKKEKKPAKKRIKEGSEKIKGFFRNIKNSIKRITVKQLIMYAVIGIILIALYILFFVPISQIAYNSAIAYYYTDQATKDFENFSMTQSLNDLERVDSSFEKINKNINKLKFLSSISIFDDLFDFQDKVGKSKTALSGSKIISEKLLPVENYLTSYERNIGLDGVDNLKVESVQSFDLSDLLGTESDIDLAKQNFEGSDAIFDNKYFEIPAVGRFFNSFQEDITTLNNSSSDVAEIFPVFPILFGINDEQTFAVLLLNEEKMTTKGGQIEAAGVFSIEDGGVTNAKVYESSEIEVKLSAQQESLVRDDLKLLYPEDGLTFSELSIIFDDDAFKNLVSLSLKKSFGKSTDHVITLNTKTLEGLISINGGIDISGVGTVNSTNFDEVLEDAEYKELLAKMIFTLFNFSRENLNSYRDLLVDHIETKDAMIYTNNLALLEFFKKNDISEESYDSFEVALISDSQILPQIDVESKIDIDTKETKQDFKVNFSGNPDGNSSGNVVLTFGSNFEITDVNASSDKVSLASSYRDKVFANFDIAGTDNENILVKGKSTNVVTKADTGYNYKLFLSKPSGTSFYYDIILNLDDDLELESAPIEASQIENTLTLEGDLEKDLLWEFDFAK